MDDPRFDFAITKIINPQDSEFLEALKKIHAIEIPEWFPRDAPRHTIVIDNT